MRVHVKPSIIKTFIVEHLRVAEYDTDIDILKKQLAEADEEFCYSFHFTQKMLNRYCYHGFLPMSVTVYGIPLLALKLHRNRVLVAPSQVRIKNNVLSKFGDHELSVDRDFDRCLKAVHDYHSDSWLSPPLAALYTRSNRSGEKRVRLHSVELWNEKDLVAGEIGYTVGASYTSLTGFHTVNSSGTAQLYALGILLEQEGFNLWDMGMYAPYKLLIGGTLHPTQEFLDILASVRDDTIGLSAKTVFLADLCKRTQSLEKKSV